MDHPISHHPVERRSDFQVGLQILERSDRRFRGLAGLLARVQQSLGRVHLLFRLNQFVSGDGAGSFGSLFHPLYVLCAAAS